MRTSVPLLFVLIIASPLVGQCRQVLPPGFEQVAGLAVSPSSVILQGRQHWVYDSSLFAAAGPITITEVEVRAQVTTQSWPSLQLGTPEIYMGTSVNGWITGVYDQDFHQNYAGDKTLVRAAAPLLTGPITATNAEVGQWIPLQLTGSFTYDPTAGRPLIIDIASCVSASFFFLDGRRQALGTGGFNSFIANGNCNATSFGTLSFDDRAPIIRLTYTGAPVQFQVDQPGASLLLPGATVGDACAVKTLTSRVDETFLVGLNDAALPPPNTTGMPFELAMSRSPAVPGGSWVSPSGQRVNVDLSAPDLTLLNEGGLVAHVPMWVPARVATPSVITAQMLNLDPSSADGYLLSAPISVDPVVPGSLGGPTSGQNRYFTLGRAPLYGPDNFPFYGTIYTRVAICEEGRLMFGGGCGSQSVGVPVSGNQSPAINLWAEFDYPAPGASILATSPTPTSIRVDFIDVPYAGTTVANSFAIEIDAADGSILISGLGGLQLHPTAAPMFMGLSPDTGALTDPGPAVFTPGGSGAATLPGDALYELGPAGTLAPGVDAILFLPDPSNPSNYAWMAL